MSAARHALALAAMPRVESQESLRSAIDREPEPIFVDIRKGSVAIAGPGVSFDMKLSGETLRQARKLMDDPRFEPEMDAWLIVRVKKI
jgi:hypothetical protein